VHQATLARLQSREVQGRQCVCGQGAAEVNKGSGDSAVFDHTAASWQQLPCMFCALCFVGV
jgi:hypothetical protein